MPAAGATWPVNWSSRFRFNRSALAHDRVSVLSVAYAVLSPAVLPAAVAAHGELIACVLATSRMANVDGRSGVGGHATLPIWLTSIWVNRATLSDVMSASRLVLTQKNKASELGDPGLGKYDFGGAGRDRTFSKSLESATC